MYVILKRSLQFGPTLAAIRKANMSAETLLAAAKPTDADDWLSLIILLDQISRNCYRDDESALVFTYFDPLARDVSLSAMARGIPDRMRWKLACRPWFYMPLMHSEELADHEKATEEYERMQADVRLLIEGVCAESGPEAEAARMVRARAEEATRLVDNYVDFEQKHFDIVKRFSRYPHRNGPLGRASTEEENDYLENGGETFRR
ncbi:hypothetical protein CDD80_7146 [Ophiocordyceps camponoti-rufipedis]|uniref:DUF924-domain-containing protein n=1 Tax=Ophiocordyceps camponoti-rufipedis TaxID=2004952 RepID=A0A2C5ZEH1_9HYPO|nr:hypothetical protein CDD80_7146 [Ophiocordyceps camponoti-rufipedis]